MREFIKLETHPYDVIRLFPDLYSKEKKTAKSDQSTFSKSTLPVWDGKDLEMGLLALIEYLTEVRFNLLRQMQNSVSKEGDHKDDSNQRLSTIDTTLLKCYLQVSWSINFNIKCIRFV